MSTVVVKNTPHSLRHPPGPYGHWLFGVIREFQVDSLKAFTELTAEYGDAIRFHAFLHYYGYIFSHPDHNKHILQDNNQNYTKIPHPAFNLLRPVIGNGLLTNDGDDWRRQRRLAQPAFHRRRIAEFGDTMTEAASRMLERWAHTVEPGGRLDVDRELMRLTLEIVGRTLFSMDITHEADRLGPAFTAVSQQIAALNAQPFADIGIRIPWLPGTRRLNRQVRIMDEVVHHIIETRRAQPEATRRTDDLLGMLMAARDEETGEGMSDGQLRDEVMTLLLAGHETTSNALTWTFYLLAQHPDVRQRLEAEIAEVLDGRTPTTADIPDLHYTTMVIEEAMRLYPPAYAMGRWCVGPDVIGGYDVPAKSIITLSPYLTHRHPDFWENPEQFDPERFTPERKAERPRYAYLPFGGGPRQCIGNNFAMTEAILLLVTIAQRYRLDLIPGQRVAMDPLVTLRPKGGLPMLINPRKGD